MNTKKPRWPRWIERDEAINLREVAPNLFVGAEYATLHPPEGTKWELVVDWYGSSKQYPSRVRSTAKKLLSLPFLDGDAFPPKALDTLVRRVQTARRRGPVLVHCQAGLSRSASSAYALLRRLSRLPHEEALRRVKVLPQYPRKETLGSARRWVEGS
jgi:hypothetical protein